MTNVLEFPEHLRLKHNLNGVRKDLKELYDTQQLIIEQLDILQKRAEEKENEYDLAFIKYMRACGGLDHVEAKFIEYLSGAISVDLSTGEIKYVLPYEKEGTDPEPGGAA